MSTDFSTVPQDILITPDIGSGPGIVLLHSGRGVTPFIHQFSQRLAREGFVTLIPDLFDGKTAHTIERSDKLKNQVNRDATKGRLEDAVEFLRQHESVSRLNIGLIGIGYGAEWACEIAPQVASVTNGIVLFYGYRETPWGTVDSPVLGHFAELDRDYPISRINDIRTTLKVNDVPHDLFVYSQTEPSFFELDQSARHRPEAAQLAWERTLHFLQTSLQGREI